MENERFGQRIGRVWDSEAFAAAGKCEEAILHAEDGLNGPLTAIAAFCELDVGVGG